MIFLETMRLIYTSFWHCLGVQFELVKAFVFDFTSTQGPNPEHVNLFTHLNHC